MSSPDKDVSLVIERHDESRRWMKDNYYGEFTEVFRSLKLRSKPIELLDQAGKPTGKEDTSKTNVAMPGPNIAWRRGVARMTASPYKLNYTGDVDPTILDRLSGLARQQYDRSGEARADRRVVMAAKAFGFGWGKLYWDSLARTAKFRRALVKDGQLMYRDRASVRSWQGVPQDEIQQEVADKGEQLTDQEVADFMGRSGYELQIPDMTDEGMAQFIQHNGEVVHVPQDIRKYEGPVLKNVFIGDLDLSPGALTLDDSDYLIESFTESDLWLKKQIETVKYLADDGKTWIQAFDPSACKELMSADPEPQVKTEDYDLRQWFLQVIGKQGDQQYRLPKKLRPRKQFDFLEQHCLGDDGRMWVMWVSPALRDKPIGRMPYPWDLGGKSTYSGLVPLEDMLGAFGDSTVRLMRFLNAMHARTVAQNFDYISNVLKRFILKATGVELNDEMITRGDFRELTVPDINKIKVLDEPPIPSGAFEREAQILRMMALLEPALNTVDTGTNSNPMAGKLATTAMINAKAFDSLTQHEIDGRDLYLKDLGEKKLAMNQQAAQEAWTIERQFWGDQLSQNVDSAGEPPQWALSSRYGKTAAVRLDPMEIQEDIGVEPESMSYLSVDDELRTSAAEKLSAAAAAAPDIFNRRKVASFYVSTIRNLPGSADDYIVPEQTGPAVPPFKGNIGVNFPMDKMPSDVVNQILPMVGLQPSQELAHRDTIDAVTRLNEAGKAANELTSPQTAATDVAPPPPPGVPSNGKPKAKSKPAR